MSSPKMVTFPIRNPSTGAAVLGKTGMSFTYYKTDAGSIVTPPSIVELGGGTYGFTPVFADPTHSLVYVLDTNGENPTDYSGVLRAEEWADPATQSTLTTAAADAATAAAQATLARQMATNKAGEADNQYVVYADNGTDVLKRFNTFDDSGSPTTTRVFSRVPTTP